MSTPVSTTDLTPRFDSVLRRIEAGDEVIVEGDGHPRAVILSFAAFQEVQAMRERQRRQDAVGRLHRLEEEIAAHNAIHNQHLTEEQAIAFAVEVGHEIVDDMAARGVLVFERDPR